MKETANIESLFRESFSHDSKSIIPLPGSGSDRKYYRISSDRISVVAVYNENSKENDAFVALSKAFIKNKLPVPEVYNYYPDKHLYFQSDLGDTSLFAWLQNIRLRENPEIKLINMYKLVLDKLIDFQVKTLADINTDICYPYKSFDRQSMMWDMNYFKYMFLKLVSVPFDENKLELDFESLANMLMKADRDYFLYRDFQSANIMIVDSMPWFIDFQGGREGAPQYDVASLLYDSKACLEQNTRDSLVKYYTDRFCSVSGYDSSSFMELYPAYVVIRIMQAMGAYGLRGLIEKKAGFAQSIAPAVSDLYYILNTGSVFSELTELKTVVDKLKDKQEYFKGIN